MNWYLLNTPQSKRYKLYYPNNATVQDKMQSLTPVQGKWQDYIESGWLSENHEDYDCTENKIKRLLSSCADMLLRGAGARDVISSYKQKQIWEHEVSLDAMIEDEYRNEDMLDM